MWLRDFSSCPDDRSGNPVKWGELNPHYELEFWDYTRCRDMIGDCYSDLLEIWESLDRVIMQADLARLLVMHQFGGVYLDMDLQPRSPIDTMLDSGVVYNMMLRLTKRLPDVPSENIVDYGKYDTILSKEHCAIDDVGLGVANGLILSKPKAPWIMDFVNQQKNAHKGLVLDYVGTWALTRYIRANVSQLRSKLLLLPPHYFLWEDRYFECDPPDYVISRHPAENTWGDPTKKQFWLV